mgnify:CR=1 FL=1|jgi:hypothetical protein
MTEPKPGDPGYGRDEDMERLRGTHRPATAHIHSEENTGHPLRVSPQPDEPDGGGVTEQI